jgi:CRP/FNR family transcriptional regulator, anaerobic regulatory protein
LSQIGLISAMPAKGAGAATCKQCGARERSVCAAIPDADLDRLSAAAIVRECARGQIFIEEGDKALDFFSITAGTAKLYKLLPDGRRQITGFAGVGHFLGLAVSDAYAFSAEAIEPLRFCRFPRARLRAIIEDFPELERRLLDVACAELVAAQNQMLLLGRKTARERIASFLLSRAELETPCGGAPRGLIHLPMTRTEIADYLGMTIETVSRTLSRFRAERRIALPSQNEVAVLDRRWLAKLAYGLDG